MAVNSLPKTVSRQRRGCDLNPGPSVPESSTLTTRLPSHPYTHTTSYRPVSSSSAIRLYSCVAVGYSEWSLCQARCKHRSVIPVTPSSLCDSCQSYIVKLTDYWTLHSWTLSLLSTPSIALTSGKQFAAKARLTSCSIWWLPFIRIPVHASGSDRNCRREFPPILKIGQYLGKLSARVLCLVFLTHGVYIYIPLSLSAKKNENRLIFGEVMGKSFVCCFSCRPILYTPWVKKTRHKTLAQNLPKY